MRNTTRYTSSVLINKHTNSTIIHQIVTTIAINISQTFPFGNAYNERVSSISTYQVCNIILSRLPLKSLIQYITSKFSASRNIEIKCSYLVHNNKQFINCDLYNFYIRFSFNIYQFLFFFWSNF